MKTKKGSRTVVLSQEQFHSIARALADPRRMAILEQVGGAETLACSALKEHESISPATISHHLKELCEAGLIDMERQGRSACLSLRRAVFEAYVQRLASLSLPGS